MLTLFLLSCFPVVIEADSYNNDGVNEFQQAYKIGRDKGILNDYNMSYEEFRSLCKNSVFPAYLQAKKEGDTLSFQQYVAADNYEIPKGLDDQTTTVSAGDESNSKTALMARSAAHKSYSMKAGDVLVVYGRNSDYRSRIIGHAAIATSSKYIMEMPGAGHRAWYSTKKGFFKRNTGKNMFVYVYRIKAHPKYADKASTYAYKYMYRKDNPKYFISTNLYHKSPSYCSKYVYLAYWWGATKSALISYKANTHIVTPHGLVGNFKGSFAPANIHKITSY